MSYSRYLEQKQNLNKGQGFKSIWLPDFLFDFQQALCDWSLWKGRSAIFADCGLGKSIMELVWAKNVCQRTKGKVLLITPIAVGAQMLAEADKFGIDGVSRSQEGESKTDITITNYERLHYFNPSDFEGVILDESGILKNFKGTYKNQIHIFMRKIRYRLLATATPSPNDFIELGTSSEALGYLGYMDMLSRFFKNDQSNCATNNKGRFTEATKWRLKGHAHESFWKWVTSWSRAIRMPSDMGFLNEDIHQGKEYTFKLPDLIEIPHKLDVARTPACGELFTFPAVGLKEVRDERKATVQERCEFVSELVNDTGDFAVVWCNLNAEGDLLEKIIPDAIQVSGRDSIDQKEGKLISFTEGNDRVLIIKPKIGAWGMNWQHCNHSTFFPAYSYEQYYQAIRREWRFGQERNVRIDLVYTNGDEFAIENLRRKQRQADEMFTSLVRHMNESLNINSSTEFQEKMETPTWA